MGGTESPTVLLFCGHTIGQKVRSGIQRVVVETARALVGRCQLRPVKWDSVDGQLRDLDLRDLRALFGEDHAPLAPHPACHRVSYRFVDTVENPDTAWLLNPEISYFLENGTRQFAAMRAQCREVGIRSAAIFYDLIPAVEQAYLAGRSAHLEYMVEMALCDRIFAISAFSGDSLVDFLAKEGALSGQQLASLRARVISTPLGECRDSEPWGVSSDLPGRVDDEPNLIMVGTVEPRKQQVRLLKALNDARRRHPVLDTLNVDVFGSLHPDCAAALHTELNRNPKIRYHHYASEEVIAGAYDRAWFSAFLSANEGYGLPIVESLRRGVPCLTSSFGAMAEVAADGGCLTVDALDDGEMVKGVLRLLTDAELVERLKEAIAKRPKRSWEDYADQILGEFADVAGADRRAEDMFAKAIRACSGGKGASLDIALHGVSWTLTADPQQAAKATDRRTGERASLLWLPKAGGAHASEAISAPDILIAAGDPDGTRIIAAANSAAIDQLLPPRAYFGPGALEAAIEGALEVSRERRRGLEARDETALRRRLLEAFWSELPHPPEKLAIVLSTYNRGGFVEHNVEWILSQIDTAGLPVRCVVVDNASADDSFRRLQRFIDHPRFTLVQNPNNLGMLGNLRVCGAGLFAPYIWLTGDDDFIVPGRIQAVLDTIDQTPGLPLIVHNFAVYHRASFSSTDHATQFLGEMQRLAPEPAPDGVRSINDIAGEHDNLYTAIYPLVFRSDVLAACFDYPFTGLPFGDLTESVPTTKILLGTYRYCAAQWFAEVGIVGNAHNSWSAHRPRWHLVLMPLVLQLARDAGVDPEKVWDWLQVHKTLFDEAMNISIAREETAHLELPADLEFARWCFRSDIALDERLKLAEPRAIKPWVPRTAASMLAPAEG